MKNRERIYEESLDPDDWEDFRRTAHRMVDDMIDYLKTVRDRSAWRPVPAEIKQKLKEPIPREGQGMDKTYRDFSEIVLPYPMGNIHPRFWAWVIGTGTPTGMMADMLASGINCNLGGAEHIANYVEEQVIEWMKEMLGYPMEASGLLVSGGSMANLVGIAVAKYNKAGFDTRREGLQISHAKLTLYGSRETHSSIQKAAELIGIGGAAFRHIDANPDFSINLDALEKAIVEDKARGMMPFCVIGAAGTTNTGAFDDFNALADICAKHELWLHVDGAFGALAHLAPELRHLTTGMERADSLAFDLHKWMHVPYDAGCVLVRNREAHLKTFSLTPEYLTHTTRGAAAGETWFSDYGVELSRNFKALKVWMSIKESGIDKIGRLIKQNTDQARYFVELVEAEPRLELLAPVPLNIVCYRYVRDGMDDERLNALNRELLLRMHESGIAVPSYTTLNGKYSLRVCVTNHRSRREDFDILAKETVRLGDELAASY